MKPSINILISTVFISITVISCGISPTNNNSNNTHLADSSKAHVWDYIGETGPEHWAQLEDNSECDGTHQSPINIVEIEAEPGTYLNKILDLDFEEETTITSITNNGHTIQFNFNGDLNKISYDDHEYKMKQFHFHSPSEHTINGVRYPLEIHLVHHCEETNAYVVFAMMVQQGEPDPTFTFLENYLPVEEGRTVPINKSYNLGSKVSDIFGMDSVDVFTYDGSLTTPPCTQNVLWIVTKNASSASIKQIEMLEKLMPKNNYRNIQPINDRVVHKEVITEIF